MKQKVIALLEPYRDKTLSFGCEVKESLYGQKLRFIRKTNVSNRCLCTGFHNSETSFSETYGVSQIEIIGHPLTLWEALQVVPKGRQPELVAIWKQGDLESQSDEVFEFLVQFV